MRPGIAQGKSGRASQTTGRKGDVEGERRDENSVFRLLRAKKGNEEIILDWGLGGVGITRRRTRASKCAVEFARWKRIEGVVERRNGGDAEPSSKMGLGTR